MNRRIEDHGGSNGMSFLRTGRRGSLSLEFPTNDVEVRSSISMPSEIVFCDTLRSPVTDGDIPQVNLTDAVRRELFQVQFEHDAPVRLVASLKLFDSGPQLLSVADHDLA